MLEMAKLFSTLINNNPPKENNPTPVEAPNPIVYTNGTILFDETIHTPRLKVIKLPYLTLNLIIKGSLEFLLKPWNLKK